MCAVSALVFGLHAVGASHPPLRVNFGQRSYSRGDSIDQIGVVRSDVAGG